MATSCLRALRAWMAAARSRRSSAWASWARAFSSCVAVRAAWASARWAMASAFALAARAHGVGDRQVGDAGDGDDVARAGFLGLDALQAHEAQHLQDLALALTWYSKAYNVSCTKTDAEFEHVRRVSSKGYEAAVALMNAGEHWDAYHQFETLCEFKGPASCYRLGLYRGAFNSPYGKDEPAALAPLAFACDHQVPGACKSHAELTGFVGPRSGYSNGSRAERYFKSVCDAATPDYEACFNVAWLNYYTDYGLNNWETIRSYSVKACFQGGHSTSCNLAMKMAQMLGPPPGSVRTESGGNWGRSVDNAIGGIFAALASGASTYAQSGSVGSSGSYSSGNAGSSTGNVAAWQANRDWNEARRATANIGTAYSSSCRPGNSYC